MKMVWADSGHLEQIYLEIAVNEGLGALVIQERKEDAPKIVFCSLFDDPVGVFCGGMDRRDAGVTLAELRRLVDEIEAVLRERPFA